MEQPPRTTAHTTSTTHPLPEKPAAAQTANMPSQFINAQHTPQPQLQPLNAPTRQPFRPSRTFSVGKLALQTFNFVCATIALGLSLALALDFSGVYYYNISTIIMAATAVISMLWQLAEYLNLLLRRTILRPIHPGAHIAAHLIIDALCVLVAVSLAFSLIALRLYYSIDSTCVDGSSSSYDYDGSTNYCGYGATFETIGQANRYFQIFEALLAFSVFMSVSHFILFVLACVETHRRRMFGKTAQYVYLVAQPGPADGRLYYTQMSPMQAAAVNQQAAVGPHMQAPGPVMQRAAAPPHSEAYGYYAPETGAATAQRTS